jgi:hypothetical protein
VISLINSRFRKCFNSLPKTIKKDASAAYKAWKKDPFTPHLRFKQIHPTIPIYSVSINRNWRALGQMKDDSIVWFWIGSHEDYNKLVKSHRLKKSSKNI